METSQAILTKARIKNCSRKVREIESGWWLGWRGWRMIIYKRPVGRSRWTFAIGWSLQMIICKRPVPPGDHLQQADPSRWSFARGRPLQMIFCKRLVPPDDHLQPRKGHEKCIFETPHNKIKCALSIEESNSNAKMDQNFHICLWSGGGVTSSPTRK